METARRIHQEIETYRVVVIAGGITHPILGAIAERGVFPLPKRMLGTITTTNTDVDGAGTIVTGVGTAFDQSTDKLGQIEPDDFIWAPAQFVARRVAKVLSGTSLRLYSPFPASLAGVDLYKIPRLFMEIYAKSTGSATAKLLEQDFIAGDTFLNHGAPVTYDVRTASSQISFKLSI